MFKSIREKFNKRPEILFFIFATLTFLVMYVWSLFVTPRLLEPLWFWVFTSLTLVHVGLHWVLGFITEESRFRGVYVVGQGVLAFGITYLSQNLGMIFCLYFALIGESVGIFKRQRWVILSILYLLALSFLNFSLLMGFDQMLWWGIGTLPLVIFVILYVSLYNRESNARAEAQKLLQELEVAHQQLAEYAAEVEDLTLSAERRRMARELHDTLAQGLAGLILQLEAADSHITSNNLVKAQSIIQQAMGRARTTLEDARLAIRDLRETPSTPANMVNAIRIDSERFTHITGIPCKLDLCVPESIGEDASENVIRAVSEGLMNIAKHAQATEAGITMSCVGECLRVEITDKGIGFDPISVVGISGHYGLLGIRERARILGGDFSVESISEQGTCVRLMLPLNSEEL
jgi:NarL family two-component system sensor histidine kinase YdfH